MPTSSLCDMMITTRTTNILRQATQAADMDFNGSWKVYSEENLEDFLKVVGKNVSLWRFKGVLCVFLQKTFAVSLRCT